MVVVPSRMYNYCSSILESPVLYLWREFLEKFVLSGFLVNPRWLWILPLGLDLLSYISQACRRFREGARTIYLIIPKNIWPGFPIPLQEIPLANFTARAPKKWHWREERYEGEIISNSDRYGIALVSPLSAESKAWSQWNRSCPREKKWKSKKFPWACRREAIRWCSDGNCDIETVMLRCQHHNARNEKNKFWTWPAESATIYRSVK